MTLPRPEFHLVRVHSDGTREAPQIVLLNAMPVQTELDRRGFFGAGMISATVLAAMGVACRRSEPAVSASPTSNTNSPAGTNAAPQQRLDCNKARAHARAVGPMVFTPDGKHLVSSIFDLSTSNFGAGPVVKFWRMPEGSIEDRQVRPDAPLDLLGRVIALSPDGARCAGVGGTYPGYLVIRDSLTDLNITPEGARHFAGDLLSPDAGRFGLAAAFHPDRLHLVFAAPAKPVGVWNLQTGHARLLEMNFTDPLESNSVMSVAFSASGRLLALGDMVGQIKVWSFPELRLLWQSPGHSVRLPLPPARPATRSSPTAPNPSGPPQARMPAAAMPPLTPEAKAAVAARQALAAKDWPFVRNSPDGQLLLVHLFHLRVTGPEDAVRIITDWTVVPDQHRFVDDRGVSAIAISGDDRWVISASLDRTLKIWDAVSGQLAKTVTGIESVINEIKPTSDGKAVFIRNGRRVLSVSLPDGVINLEFQLAESVTSFAISPDGTCLATGFSNGAIRLWELPGGGERGCLMDLNIMQSDTLGMTFHHVGDSRTFTLPCGSRIPPGAICTCNCIPGRITVTPIGGGGRGGESRTICTCIPVFRSDRDAKLDVTTVEKQAMLERLAAMPINAWRYKEESEGVRHIGPMAQDFAAAFGLGDSDKHIHAVDAHGVTLAAIQALVERMKAQEEQLSEQEQLITELHRQVERLNKRQA